MEFDLSKPQKLLRETARATLVRDCPLSRVREWMANDMTKDDSLRSIIAGEHNATVALMDQYGDWDLESITMPLTPSQLGWKLTGRKTLVLDAEAAHTVLCVVRQGSTLAIVSVPMKASGVILERKTSLDATRKLYDVAFNDAAVAESDVLSIGDQAHSAIERSVRVATLAACAEMLGAMQWIHETTLEYAQTRKQFDRTIGSYQAVQHQCADTHLMTESARAATYYAAWALTSNAPDACKAIAIAKAYCSEVGREVGHRGVQVHGGIGFTWEHDMHLFLKRIKVCEFLFGDATWQREQIARRILK